MNTSSACCSPRRWAAQRACTAAWKLRAISTWIRPRSPPASRESISDTDRASSATGLKPSTTMARETVLTAWREWLK